MSRTRGISIAIFGTDGSGKTTVAELLEQYLGQHGFEVRHLHWRPEILLSPIRSSGSPELVHDVTRPHAREVRSKATSTLLMFYYLIDFWMGYIFQTTLFLRRRTSVVIFERYLHDAIIDPKRYRLTPNCGMERLLQRLAPPVTITVVLHGDPEVIFERKYEIPPQEIVRQQELTFAMFTNSPDAYFLDVTYVQPDAIAREILEIVGFSLWRDSVDLEEL